MALLTLRLRRLRTFGWPSGKRVLDPFFYQARGGQASNAVGGAVFVAGWYNLRNLETDEEKRIAGPWVNEPRDDKKIREVVNRAVAIFSDNDPFVIPENQKSWKERVGAKIIIEQNKGHFSGSDGITKLPSALDSVLELARK